MQTQDGDEFIRELASFIRQNERGLAESGPARRRIQPQQSSSYLSSWLSSAASSAAPVLLKTDAHHLFYLFIRLEALGLPVGSLDVHVDSPSRPMSYPNIYPEQRNADSISFTSLRSSLSVVSNFSLGGGWWNRSEPPNIDAELKYIYSSFTKLPALSIGPPTKEIINDLLRDPPGQNAIPLDAFKNLHFLECWDIDPRILLGWDRLAESLQSLKIRNSGLQDITALFIGAVLDDQSRRQGSASRSRHRNIPQTAIADQPPPSDQALERDNSSSSTATSVPSAVTTPALAPPSQLSPLKWAFLKYLSLPDNGLTFFPSDLIPHLKYIAHLDLSSNLLVSVPAGLGELYNLVSLNLTDNLIDSVLGIYQNLGQILSLNLSGNRLDSICGLERLLGLERVDLRYNLLEESAEIGRLASLPNISQLWVEGNPFVEFEERYRINCFDYFWKEGKHITLDGTSPTLFERRNLSVQESSLSTPPFVSSSVPLISVEPSVFSAPSLHRESSSTSPSPHLSPISGSSVGPGRKKKPKRIVDLNEDKSGEILQPDSHVQIDTVGFHRTPSNGVPNPQPDDPATIKAEDNTPSTPASSLTSDPISEDRPPRRSRHNRYQTEYNPAFPSPNIPQRNPTLISRPNLITGSATISPRSERRRARVSASVFEPDAWPRQLSAVDDDAATFRKKIESLKNDMGDSWLKVYNQSQPSP